MKPVAVVGGGFKGIVVAKLLADMGKKVVLVEQAKNLGGIMFSIPWDGFQLDLGCHIFSNENNQTTKIIFDLLGENPNGINPKVKSVFQGKQTEGIEYPDFTHLNQNADFLLDLLTHAARKRESVLAKPNIQQSLEEYLTNRYGDKVAGLLESALYKLLNEKTGNISSFAFSAIPAKRVYLAEPVLASMLKQLPVLDELIVNPSPDDPMRYVRKNANNFDHRCFYPANGGMNAFAANAKQHLLSLGVQVQTETSVSNIHVAESGKLSLHLSDSEVIECTELYWTSGTQALANSLRLTINLAPYIHSVPMVLFYFDVPLESVGSYTWVQDFDKNHFIYRASAPSTYGLGTAPEGRAYVLAEVLTDISSDIYTNSESYTAKIWNEIVDLGVCSGVLPGHRKIMKTSASYKFPKVDFQHGKAHLDKYIEAHNNIHLFDEWVFGKAACVDEILNTLIDQN